ncbi:MAG: glycine--tRNA ligase subunit beta [Candidatus Krumholzibacteriia bacterium]
MTPDPKETATLPFLLEIGSEEIPARFIPGSMAELEAGLRAALDGAHLQADEWRVMATPRRLAVRVGKLAARQPDREIEIKGPPVSVAFGPDGKPTPAGEGFARKAGVSLAECGRGGDERGEFLVARKREDGLPAAEVLAGILPGIILGLPFRKVMRWGDHDLEYPRPLQWIAALLGEDVVAFKVDYLASGRLTRGHRTLAGGRDLQIASPETYEDALAEAGVVVDQNRRRSLILEGLAAELAAFDPAAELVMDEDLLEEVVFLCEHPTPFLGAYSEDYAVLPAEVVTTALKSHQRYFTVRDRGTGGLLPRFAAVRDGGRDHLANVIAGNERVLRARLADALFYWEFDQKKSPDERVALLASVTWLEGFGSVLDRSRRLERLAPWLWTAGLGLGAEAPGALARAAWLAKSDLTSEMIKDGKEFTKLEGFIGARYAELAGESPEVCAAIEGHYAPRSAGGSLPADPVSSCLSLADRLDTVAGCWLAGFAPTGAKDPYALRRHVLAVIRILVARGWRLDLEAALARALEAFAGFVPAGDSPRAAGELADFIRARMEGYFTEVQGAVPEVVRAVLPARWRDPTDALAWIQALTEYRDHPDFQMVATGFKRCRNILKGDVLAVEALDACLDRWLAGGEGAAGESFAGLTEAAECDLLRKVAGAARTVADAERDGRYSDVFAQLSSLGPSIDHFFDSVRVNVDEEELRLLRTAFLKEIHGIFARYGDFTEMAAATS